MSATVIPSENPSVNRWLKDKAMDHIDHALGRPVWPRRKTYRNHFSTDAGGPTAAAFESSPYWRKYGQHRDMAFFLVTSAGREALAAHLDGLDVGERHRAYEVTYEGQSRIVPAKSRSHARYSEYLTISDCFSELTFGEFIKHSSVRLAA